MTNSYTINDLYQPSNYDKFFMQRSLVFSDSLKDLRNIRTQLYSAAEFFEDSYHKNNRDQLLIESLKDYVSKAIISTIDHLGSVTSKVNTFLDENIDEAFETSVRVSCLEQRLKTCQKYSYHSGLSQRSLVMQIPKYHKQYLLPEGRIWEAVKAEYTKTESSGLSRGNTKRASKEFPSGLVAFSFVQTASNKRIEKRTRSLSPSRFRIRRSGSVANPSASPIYPVVHSGTLIRRPISPNSQQHSPGSEKRKDIEVYFKKTKNIFKAFLSIRKHQNDSLPYT